MIPEETIARVAAASDIVDIIGSRVPLKQAGSVFKALCPFHSEKTPSFQVSPARQTFHCFGCDAGGSVFKFLTLFDNISFPDAVHLLAEKAGIPVVEDDWGDAARDGGGERTNRQTRSRLFALHADAAAWFHRNLMKTPAASHARDYLKSRGLNDEVAARWQLGYAPQSGAALPQWAADTGYRPDELVLGGLTAVSDHGPYSRFRDRLMFPICDAEGKVIAFSGRVLSADAPGGKYVNSPETPLFTKGKVLFGFDKAKRALLAARSAIVCEGQIDLITAFEAGITNVTAAQGTAFTERQAILLKRHVDEAILCFDADPAGQQAVERTLAAFLEANLSVRVVTMPPGEDPDSLIRGQGAAAFQARLATAQDFFDFQLERLAGFFDLRTPRGKAQYAQRMAESVVLLTDHVLREAVIGKVTARLGLAPDDFRPLLKRRPGLARRADIDLTGPGTAETDPHAPGEPRFERPSPTVALLLKVALEHEEARAWLQAQAWRERLPHVAGSELLSQALAAELSPGEAASVNAFIATLPAAAESFLAGLLMDRPFPQPLQVARESWRGLEKSLWQERIKALHSRLRLPELTIEEVTRLNKEILDLKQRLQDIAQP